MGTQTTRSRALASHIRSIYHTFSLSCPVSAAAAKIHAVCDIVICLAMTPFPVSVKVTGGCTPHFVVFRANGRALREDLVIVNEWEDARRMVIVP